MVISGKGYDIGNNEGNFVSSDNLVLSILDSVNVSSIVVRNTITDDARKLNIMVAKKDRTIMFINLQISADGMVSYYVDGSYIFSMKENKLVDKFGEENGMFSQNSYAAIVKYVMKSDKV